MQSFLGYALPGKDRPYPKFIVIVYTKRYDDLSGRIGGY
jgi:hypothetical protein